MPAKEHKPWPPPAKHEHILGEVRRAGNGDATMTVLFLYHDAVERQAWPPEEPIIQARLLGEASEIYCTICQADVARWDFSQEMIDALLERVQKPVV